MAYAALTLEAGQSLSRVVAYLDDGWDLAQESFAGVRRELPALERQASLMGLA